MSAGAGFEGDGWSFEWNEQGYRSAFQDWEGMTGKWLSGVGSKIEYQAVAAVPVRTGALRDAISQSKQTWGGGDLELRVGANPDGETVGYALYMHEGTDPHLILPVPPTRALRFVVDGRVVFARSVRHPGTRPHPYLTPFLQEAIS